MTLTIVKTGAAAIPVFVLLSSAQRTATGTPVFKICDTSQNIVFCPPFHSPSIQLMWTMQLWKKYL